MANYKVDIRSKFVWQNPVEDKDLTTSPAASKGDRYIIAGIGGDWSGGTINDIAVYDGASWVFYTPAEGWICWIKDENEFYKFGGASWTKYIGQVGATGPTGATGPSGSAYTTSFVNGDLVSGILTVTHSLTITYPIPIIYDNNDKEIQPDEIEYIDTNTIKVDLSSYGSITGTWNVRVISGSGIEGATGPTGPIGPSGPSGSAYTTSFVNGDLVSDKIIITHNLGITFPLVQVFDENDNKIIPTEITYKTTNTVELDFTTMTPLSGTYNVRVISGSSPQGATGPTGPTGPSELTVGINLDGGGDVISTGYKGFIRIPYNCTITKWTILADQSGSIKIDIWKDSYANYPPTDADTITAANEPEISASDKAQDSTLSGWTTSISAGDILAFNVDSCSSIKQAILILEVTKS